MFLGAETSGICKRHTNEQKGSFLFDLPMGTRDNLSHFLRVRILFHLNSFKFTQNHNPSRNILLFFSPSFFELIAEADTARVAAVDSQQ